MKTLSDNLMGIGKMTVEDGCEEIIKYIKQAVKELMEVEVVCCCGDCNNDWRDKVKEIFGDELI